MLKGNYQSVQASSPAMQRRRSDQDVMQLLLEYRQAKSPKLRDQIVSQFTNLVESIARRFSGAAEPVEDLAQEGYIGLLTAIELYDPTKNVKFSTYATHFVIGQIKHCLRDRGKIIKEPAWLQELNQRMTRVIEALTQEHGQPPSNLRIAQMMSMTEEAVAEMMMTREVFKVSSIDGGSDGDEETGGTVNMERQRGKETTVTFQLPLEERIVLDTAMLKLKELEQTVLTEFYFKDLNQTEIAGRLGISCNYVSHILRTSTKKLKKILVTEDLREAQRKVTLLQNRVDEQQSAVEQQVVDGMTRLYNRHYFETRLEEELSRASRSASSAAVLFVTLHGLTPFTRASGTLRGDEAVTGLADTIRKTVRRTDIVTRYDTDTFALILPHTGAAVIAAAERLRVAMENFLTEKNMNEGLHPLTLTIGAASYPQEASQAAALTLLARERLTAGMPSAAVRAA